MLLPLHTSVWHDGAILSHIPLCQESLQIASAGSTAGSGRSAITYVGGTAQRSAKRVKFDGKFMPCGETQTLAIEYTLAGVHGLMLSRFF